MPRVDNRVDQTFMHLDIIKFAECALELHKNLAKYLLLLLGVGKQTDKKLRAVAQFLDRNAELVSSAHVEMFEFFDFPDDFLGAPCQDFAGKGRDGAGAGPAP